MNIRDFEITTYLLKVFEKNAGRLKRFGCEKALQFCKICLNRKLKIPYQKVQDKFL